MPPSLATTQNSLPGGCQPFPGGIGYPLSSSEQFLLSRFPCSRAYHGAIRVEPAGARRLPHRPVLADFPHTVPPVAVWHYPPPVSCSHALRSLSIGHVSSRRCRNRACPFPNPRLRVPTVRRVCCGTMSPLRLPCAFPNAPFIALRRIPWGGFPLSLLAAGLPATTRPGCC